MRYFLSVLLVFGLVGCSDDSSPPPGADGTVDSALTDTSTGKDGAGSDGTADKSVTPDKSLADKTVADKTVAKDATKTPKIPHELAHRLDQEELLRERLPHQAGHGSHGH